MPERNPPKDVEEGLASLQRMVQRGMRPVALRLRMEDEGSEHTAEDKASSTARVLVALAPPASLKELRLHGVGLTTELLGAMAAAAPGAESLTLGGDPGPTSVLAAGLSALPGALPGLTSIALHNPRLDTDLPGAAWEALSQLSGLRKLGLWVDSPRFFGGLTRVASLPALSINATSKRDWRSGQQWPEEDLQRILPHLTALTSLSLSLMHVMDGNGSDLGLPALGGNLRSLDLSLAHVKGGLMAALPALTALTRLSLGRFSGRAYRPEALWPLPPQLRSLRLVLKDLDAEALSNLQPPPSLTELRIVGGPISLPWNASEAARAVSALAADLRDTLAGATLSLEDVHGMTRPRLRWASPQEGEEAEEEEEEAARGAWLSALAPLRLGGLELRGARLTERCMRVLREELTTIKDLRLRGCETPPEQPRRSAWRSHEAP